jgi:hypothetical protein
MPEVIAWVMKIMITEVTRPIFSTKIKKLPYVLKSRAEGVLSSLLLCI